MSPVSVARTCLATVCLSGALEDKLAAAAAAGFDGVEIFEPDLVASPARPGEVRRRCEDLGLAIELYQPFRDLDSTDEGRFDAAMRRAAAKFAVMTALGVDTVLVCSSVAADAVDDVDRLAEQLAALADRAADAGVRVAYEALAWGRHVSTWERSWEVVRRADHPALGLCLDSFHVLSRGGDTAGVAAVPGEKLFFLQLADAQDLSMDTLTWSRHHRLFPGQGGLDLPAFLAPVLDAGYSGPLSLEVFNDVFRQADPYRTAVDAHRCLLGLAEQTASRGSGTDPVAAPPPGLDGLAFVELSIEHDDDLAGTLTALGMVRTGIHRTKAVERWETGDARLLVNRSRGGPIAVTALAVASRDPDASARRAARLGASRLERERGPAEADLFAVIAPDGTEVFFCPAGADAAWTADFVPTGAEPATSGIVGIDHLGMAQPFDHFDEAAAFYRTVLGLSPDGTDEFAAPFGLVRAMAVADPRRRVRLALTTSRLRRGPWAPGVSEPQYVALACDDLVATARRAAEAGARFVPVPDNYYDDLGARLELPGEQLETYRELGVLLERDARGSYLALATEVLGGRVFLALVQRVDGYAGYGWSQAPVRMAAHHRRRMARKATITAAVPSAMTAQKPSSTTTSRSGSPSRL